MPFIPCVRYTRNDIYQILNVPEDKRRGHWESGLHYFNGENYIFASMEVPTTTGHNYQNRWLENRFEWFGKSGSLIRHVGVGRLFQPNAVNHLFTKIGSSTSFEYNGLVRAAKPESQNPIRVLWSVINNGITDYPDEVSPDAGAPLYEGATSQVLVNRYERNIEARKLCLAHYGGPTCQICKFNFSKAYGPIGDGLIHVHHLKLLSSVGKTYKINPVKDLLPVCPNCHAMLHRSNPPYTPALVRKMLTASSR